MEYPTLFTAGTRWLAPAARHDARGASPCTKPGINSGTASSATTSSKTRGWTKGSTPSRPPVPIAQVYDPNFYSRTLLRRLHAVGIQGLALPRETDGNGLSGYRCRRESDAQSTPIVPLLSASGGASRTTRPALWLNTMERWLGWPTVQEIMATHFARWKFKHPKPADFFAIASEVARPRPRRVLRPGLSQLERVRLRRAGTADGSRRRPFPHDGRRAPIRRGDLPGGRAGDVRKRRTDH